MEINEILKHCDHTLLAQTATFDDIKALLDDGIKYGVASCCIPPCFVSEAKKYVGDKLAICTVIGFPNGYNSREVKEFEAERAIADGADELDMVINIGDVKAGRFDKIAQEIIAIKSICTNKILKVIIETCLLTDEEKIRLCEVVANSHADFIKTSTGFSTGGATSADISLFKKHLPDDVLIKAAGGISTVEDAEVFLSLGAERLGTSKIVKIVKRMDEVKGG